MTISKIIAQSAFAAVLVFGAAGMPSATQAYDYSYTPSYDYSYTPSYDYSYTPSYDYSYTPSYDYSYTPSFGFAGGSANTTPVVYDVVDVSSYTPSYGFVNLASYTPKYGFAKSTGGKYNVSYGFAGSGSNVNTNTNTVIVNNTGTQHTVNSGSIVPSCTISANPTNPTYNGSTTITWNASNATSATLTDAGTVATSGSRLFSNITSTRTYSLTVYGTGGTATCSTTVFVNTQPQVQPSCTLSASPSSLSYGGGSATLYWSTTNANSASIDQGIGSVTTAGGSRSIYPYSSTTYTMTVTGNYGTSNTCTTTVTVGSYNPAPTPSNLWCTISVQPDVVVPNTGTAILTWQSGGAVSANLSEVGPVATHGTRTITPGYSHTYTLTVRDYAGRTETCSTPVNVGGTGYYPPAPTPGGNFISLTQVPYTGFDFGVMGNMLYWLTLIALAGGVAYTLVFFRGGVLNGFAFAPVAGGARFLSEDVIEEKNEEDEAEKGANEDEVAAGDSMSLATAENGMPRLTVTRSMGNEDLPRA